MSERDELTPLANQVLELLRERGPAPLDMIHRVVFGAPLGGEPRTSTEIELVAAVDDLDARGLVEPVEDYSTLWAVWKATAPEGYA